MKLPIGVLTAGTITTFMPMIIVLNVFVNVRIKEIQKVYNQINPLKTVGL